MFVYPTKHFTMHKINPNLTMCLTQHPSCTPSLTLHNTYVRTTKYQHTSAPLPPLPTSHVSPSSMEAIVPQHPNRATISNTSHPTKPCPPCTYPANLLHDIQSRPHLQPRHPITSQQAPALPATNPCARDADWRKGGVGELVRMGGY